MPFGSFEEAYSNTSTLGYFNSAQALADYAEVLVSLKKNLSAGSSPVIVIVGSYGGTSSAPILYFEDITPHEQYYLIATNDYKEDSMTCYDTIRQSCRIKSSSEVKNDLERIYTSAAQYDKPPIYPVKMICDAIDVASKRTTDILARILAGVAAVKGNETCYDLNQIVTEADIGW
ncbi:hypothetical protein IFM89_006235 [Coptis chinensis]|uniref:Uncharacterized protein n=1 Tax=Coptis chinensis TaxID=261450 RepID=A0A835ME98_9MAGN|nr:hypothetical protein IFM89_006235 [Coptis chinensis]